MKNNSANRFEAKGGKIFLLMICLVAAMGGFLFGYDWVVVGGAKPFYEPFFQLESPAMKGWGTSSALIGCIFGALFCFLMTDKYGRQKLLVFAGFLFTVSAIGTAVCDQFSWYNIYRIVGGFGIGIALNLSPMYIAEMAPPHIRGKLVSLNQLLVMFGILAAQITNWQISLLDTSLPAVATNEMIRESWNGQYGWRYMFGAEVLPAAIFFLLMIFMPESVRWLVKSGQDTKAFDILEKIGGIDYAKEESISIRQSIDEETALEKNSFKELLKPGMIKILLLGIFIAVLQQWCGMNVIFYYAADIFEAAGYNLKELMLQIVVIGSIMVASVLVTIAVVDKVGRKFLMILGTGSLAAIYIVEGILFHYNITGVAIVLLTLASVAVYSLTLAPVTWVILSEIFPNRVRGAAMSLAAITLWIANFLLTFTFPAIKETLGWTLNFWLYAAICIIGLLVVLFKLPETNKKSLEEIEKLILEK